MQTIFNLNPFDKNMKKILIIAILPILFMYAGCDKPAVEKPENLINEKKMIGMLAEIHLAEAAYTNLRHKDSLVEKSSRANFYYSVLNKYQIPDTVFEKSLLYYASQPRNFEKMYRQVMNQLNEMEQSFSGRKNDLLDIEVQENER